MKVKLLTAIAGIGRTGEIVNVSDAQARNYLIPKKLAVLATGAVVKAQAQAVAEQKQQQSQRQAALVALTERLEKQPLRLRGKANDQGKLFAAIKAADIQAGLEQQFKLKFPDLVCQPDHLKTLGTHKVQLTIDHAHQAEISIIIVHA